MNLTVQRGEILTLFGPNGAGKSTILKLLAGSHLPQQGEAQVLGAAHSAETRRRIGVVLQEPSTDDLMSLRETLELHGRLFGIRGVELSRRCDELLDQLGLAERRDDRCESLSGGLRRRLDIARALMHQPELLLLDEPTLALDPASSDAIWKAIHERVEQGVSVVVCSNDTEEAERWTDRVIFVDEGQIIAEGTPDELRAGLRSDALELDWPSVTDSELAELAQRSQWPEIGQAMRTGDGVLLTVDGSAELAPRLLQRFGGAIRGLQIRESSLRDAWLQLIGTPLEGD